MGLAARAAGRDRALALSPGWNDRSALVKSGIAVSRITHRCAMLHPGYEQGEHAQTQPRWDRDRRAANGIGRAIALSLLQSKWRVVALDVPGAGLAGKFSRHRGAAMLEGDVAQEETATRAVELARERFGRIDAVVSNAGIARNKPIAKLTLAERHRVLDVNLTAAFVFARAAETELRKSKGALVLIASTRAVMSEAHTEAYSASKGGLVALTHALAISLAPNVRVNCVSPGWIKTGDYRDLRRKDHTQHPAGRVGKPEDIAAIVQFLLDRERAGFITGANFLVDGGMTRKMIYVE
jgi:NAD(P)-dependent dehydrogenase (short-subunit alcohol dehydrogenase family)